MGYNKEGLLDYIKHDQEIASRVVGSAATIDYLKGFNSLVFGKGSVALTALNTTVVFGDGSSCARVDTGGASTLTQRTIQFVPLTEYTSYCEKELYDTWMNEKISKGQKEEKLDADVWNKIVSDRADRIAAEHDKLIWQGSVTGGTGNMAKYDGFNEVISKDGETLTLTGTTAIGQLQHFVKQIPQALKTDKDFRVHIAKEVEDAIVAELYAANRFHNPEASMIPGTTIKYVVMPGMNGSNKVVGAKGTNLRVIIDDAADANTIDAFFDKLSKQTKLDFQFGGGVQITIADEAYIASIAV